MKNWKRYVGNGLAATFVGFTIFAINAVLSQSAIIRGESSPGVYETIKTDGAQHMQVAIVSNTASGVTSTATWTITTSPVTSTSATLLAANSARKSLLVQNNDSTGIVYLGFQAPATASGVKLGPGMSFFVNQAVPVNILTAIGSIANNTNVTTVEGN